MTTTVLAYSGILLASVFISAVSQVMLKKSALKTYDSPIKEYLNPLVIFAYALFVGTTLLSVRHRLRRAHLQGAHDEGQAGGARSHHRRHRGVRAESVEMHACALTPDTDML